MTVLLTHLALSLRVTIKSDFQRYLSSPDDLQSVHSPSNWSINSGLCLGYLSPARHDIVIRNPHWIYHKTVDINVFDRISNEKEYNSGKDSVRKLRSLM